MKYINTTLACLAICSSTTYGQIVNGSFENNDFDKNTYAGNGEIGSTDFDVDDDSITATGWTFTNGSGIALFKSTKGTTDGKYAGAMSNGESISQELTFATKGTYQITFDLFVEETLSADYSYGMRKTGSSTLFTGTGTKTDTGSAITITETFTVDSTGANAYAFIIQNNKKTGGNLFVDNVNITAVPEPSSSALLGLGGMALLFRRRK